MSYEGHSQFLCKNGHYWEVNCYELPNLMYEKDVKQKCPKCNKSAVWENMVNVTNGSFDDDGTRIDNYVELKQKSELSGVCSACGKKHVCETTYYKPKENNVKDEKEKRKNKR